MPKTKKQHTPSFQPGDLKESTINFFHFSGKTEPCSLYTSLDSVKDQLLRRNPNCKVQNLNPGWMLTYDRSQVRNPVLWVKKVGELDEEDDGTVEELDTQSTQELDSMLE